MTDCSDCRERLVEILQNFKQEILGIPKNYMAILELKFDLVLKHFDVIVQHTDDRGLVDYAWLKEDTMRVAAEIDQRLLALNREVAEIFIACHQPNTRLYIERLEAFAYQDSGKLTLNVITLELKKLLRRSCNDFTEAYMIKKLREYELIENAA